MARIRVPRRGPGRAGTWPGRVAADKGCSSIQIRTYLRRRRTKAATPERSLAPPGIADATWAVSSKWVCRMTFTGQPSGELEK